MFHIPIAIQILLSLYSTTFANPLIGDENSGITPALEGEFPFVVSIGLDVGGREHFCTGSLITRTHVLTAAHCFNNRRPKYIRVLVGTNDLTRGGKKYRLSGIDSWITFNSWASKTNNAHLSRYAANDIAIVTLFQEVNETIPLPILSHRTDEEHYGVTVITAGWGDMKDGVKPDLLQKAPVHVMSRTECEDRMVELGYGRDHAQENELCTWADPSVLLGTGDSGGPLLINGNEIIGVNEAICPNDRITPRAFNLHTTIHYYRRFINSVIGRC